MNDEREILEVHRKWIAFETAGDVRAVLSLCAPDVVWLVPGLGMLNGVDEVGAFLENNSEGEIVSIDTYDVEIELSGALAVKKAKFRTTLLNASSEFQVLGAHIWTLRKNEESNQWKVTGVAWSIED